MDQTDLLILSELSKNSRITMKELGEKVHMTGQAAASRVAKLEDTGVLEGYTIKVNQSKLGCIIHAFITLYTNTLNHQPLLAYIKMKEPFVLNTYKIGGDGCYLLECRFPSNQHIDEFLDGLNEYANYKVSMVIKKS
ncbi:HTH-type transcriptional regulator LrpC [Paenibacillus auburnensis]|jgi:Lrp/AsnC family transcriptional regulator, leucine-responsive regulatory protein|uniref:HTH-type transcriptional regulator LrpC n=1 Tax=Paenibacillus auburnensis TaxID=2905649 RepID=A0ABN8G1P8_9BACL|nr:winged helix-turn-helix transcriptional regulator [Paenibacillus auburnensis]CAH1195277.1 HTH-type transcriptional regulator LrpC [Paenibacillus auburnensis]